MKCEDCNMADACKREDGEICYLCKYKYEYSPCIECDTNNCFFEPIKKDDD